ncbi:MAG: DNA-binding FadR family transcriptional regulator [Alpinimonas sp.]|jgi:DNA-binding FadR family transcriptional regulator
MPSFIRASSLSKAAVFAPLEEAGRAELVEQRLSDAIILGLLEDGERLPSESELGRQLGVAPVTAREALEALREKGLIRTKRGRDGGSFVTYSASLRREMLTDRLRALSRVEIRDLGAHCMAIAAMATEMAADRTSDDDCENLRGLLERADYGSENSARRITTTISLELAALSHSARLVREEIKLQAEFGSILWLGLRDASFRERTRKTHLALVEALAARDGTAARVLTSEHIAFAIGWLIAAKNTTDFPLVVS